MSSQAQIVRPQKKVDGKKGKVLAPVQARKVAPVSGGVKTAKKRRQNKLRSSVQKIICQQKMSDKKPAMPLTAIRKEAHFIIGHMNPALRIAKDAVKALRDAAESYVDVIFRKAVKIQIAAKRQTMMHDDLRLAIDEDEYDFYRRAPDDDSQLALFRRLVGRPPTWQELSNLPPLLLELQHFNDVAKRVPTDWEFKHLSTETSKLRELERKRQQKQKAAPVAEVPVEEKKHVVIIDDELKVESTGMDAKLDAHALSNFAPIAPESKATAPESAAALATASSSSSAPASAVVQEEKKVDPIPVVVPEPVPVVAMDVSVVQPDIPMIPISFAQVPPMPDEPSLPKKARRRVKPYASRELAKLADFNNASITHPPSPVH